jgi:hypothetical protein
MLLEIAPCLHRGRLTEEEDGQASKDVDSDQERSLLKARSDHPGLSLMHDSY